MGMVKDLGSNDTGIGVAVTGAYASIIQTPTLRKGGFPSNGFTVEVHASKTARDAGEQCFQKLTKQYQLKAAADCAENELSLEDYYTVCTGGTVNDVCGTGQSSVGDDMKLIYLYLSTLTEWTSWVSDEE